MGIDATINKLKTESVDGNAIDVIAVRILENLSQRPAQETRFLTFQTMLNILDESELSVEIIAAVNKLTNPRYAILQPLAIYRDEVGEHILSSEDLAMLYSTGKFVHPETGEFVEDGTSSTLPYFAVVEDDAHS